MWVDVTGFRIKNTIIFHKQYQKTFIFIEYHLNQFCLI